ncbi:M15 family metallopeptidase [Vibrio panuliri]|uniref:Peptidase M15 n=1 Tax=Vibrio panuliri TaxID=1381081 RepID=A0A1Q9HM76_9VIBR|nr:M15 family metallopeptidase [Vibrio panuliri]KAB1455534.1 M15 family metallopeptidase [Vibrio panuliri]OLQ91721.1 peptidase M15 [Vibrio panuliri]OLQ94764.1 peptidase M15 [Vibrio panuliri]
MTPEQLSGISSDHLVKLLFGQKVFLVHPAVEQDLLSLKNAAAQAGFNLNIASGFRDFERQKLIWNNKMSGVSAILDKHSQPLDTALMSCAEKITAILRWSALPGASRHHWGSDFDVFDRNSLPEGVSLQLEPWEYLTGHQAKFYQWLTANLNQYGFFFPYAKDLGGVAPEPWHISHKTTAQACLSQLTLEQLQFRLRLSPILGNQVVLEQLENIYNQFITNISGDE